MHTQTDRILNHLRQKRTITPLEAQDLFGCMRLGGRIYDLKQLGYVIESKVVSVPNRYGRMVRVAQYRLRSEPAKV